MNPSKDGIPSKLVRPTGLRTKSSTSTNDSLDGVRSASAPSASTSTSITGDIVKKLSLNTAISPLNANRPGRLPSFRGERDLSLGGARTSQLSAVESGGAKPKKEFKPTIPARRTKTNDSQPAKDEKSSEISSRGRGRKDGSQRGRGRGRQDLIQTTGSIFGDGVSDLGLKSRNSSSYGDREGSGGGSSGGLEKPRLNTQYTKVNKEEEDAALSALLKDDFLDDDEHDNGFDSGMLVQPVQLPKTSLDINVKEETVVSIKLEKQPAILLESGITIKEEKNDSKAVPAKSTSTYDRRLKPSQITGEQIFQNENEILFIQLPDVLPSLKSDKDPSKVKTEPGIVHEEASEAPIPDEKSNTGVFEDIPEGRLGTLRIHKSGKLTLQMGEHSFVLDSATQVSYLQDLVSIEVNMEEKSGNMKALGPIKYKTVCLPDWDELIDDS